MDWRRAALAAVVSAGIALDASAAAEALTLERAVSLALERSAELAAAANERAAAEAAVGQAGALPNPQLELGADNLGNARKRDAGDRATSIQLAQLVELGGKRDARVRMAQAARDAAGWELKAKRAEIVARATQGFFAVLVSQERLALAEDSMALAQRFSAAVAKRVEAGKVSPVEETKAKLALAQAQVEREQASRELAAARQRLAAVWGDAAAQFEKAEGSLEQVPMLSRFDELAAALESNPEYARWSAERERRRAAVESERAKAVPDITVTGGVTRFSEFNDRAYMIGIAIPLPVFDQNRHGIEEAHRRLDKAADEQRAAQSRLRAELAETYQRASSARSEIDALRDAILPGAQSAFDAANRGYQEGKFGFLDVLDAQRTLFQVRAQHLRALLEYRRALSELERLTGTAQPGTKPGRFQ